MKPKIKVSIIIINYNYGRFLPDSIGSCLDQTYDNIQIVVVDDGSTDNSRDIIEKYPSVQKIYQSNKGMMEAANSGFKSSKGDIIIFLDADDYLFSDTVTRVTEKWDQGMSMLHFRLKIIDSDGNETGYIPSLTEKLSEGAVWEKIEKMGSYVSSPMSGNAYNKKVLNNIFPVKNTIISKDCDSYFNRINTDAYLNRIIPLLGSIGAIQNPLGVYRIHGNNNGGTTYNYFNRFKRQRKLFVARKNAVFIKNHFKKMNIEWEENTIFKEKRMMILRILSFRFERKDHLWENDTYFHLIQKIIKNYFDRPYDKIIKKTFNYFVLVLLCIMPRRIVMLILKSYFKLIKK